MFYKLIIKLTNRSILLLIRFSIQDRGIDPGIFDRIFTIGFSHARPNSGISGALLSENEAKPVVICCSGGGC